MGDLIPRHMQIFKSNEFFCGLSIPDPGTLDPLEGKLAKGPAGAEGIDFMKVLSSFLLFTFYYMFVIDYGAVIIVVIF